MATLDKHKLYSVKGYRKILPIDKISKYNYLNDFIKSNTFEIYEIANGKDRFKFEEELNGKINESIKNDYIIKKTTELGNIIWIGNYKECKAKTTMDKVDSSGSISIWTIWTYMNINVYYSYFIE